MKDKLPKPTEDELVRTEKMLLDKYDVVIPKESLLKITALLKEFGQYVSINDKKIPKRILDEIKAIVIEHRPIPYEPIVEKKTSKLFELQYNVSLTQSQIEQVVQFLTRTLWFQEGLDESLEKCLDDLLLFADMQKRGKRTNGINSHDKIRKALDEAMGRLNIPNTGWERFYKES